MFYGTKFNQISHFFPEILDRRFIRVGFFLVAESKFYMCSSILLFNEIPCIFFYDTGEVCIVLADHGEALCPPQFVLVSGAGLVDLDEPDYLDDPPLFLFFFLCYLLSHSFSPFLADLSSVKIFLFKFLYYIAFPYNSSLLFIS